MPSHFDGLATYEINQIWFYYELFVKDKSPDKIDLTVGAYQDQDGNPYVFNVVRVAEKIISDDKTSDKEYLSLEGNPVFNKLAQDFMFGDCDSVKENRIITFQSIAGTGALRLAFEFLTRTKINNKIAYISEPTWPNHKDILELLDYKIIQYPYHDKKSNSLRLSEMLDSLSNAQPHSIILFHLCAHNPTGVDPSHEEWMQICEVVKERNLLPFFDCAYQGFATGDTDEDVWAVRYFEKQGLEMIVSQSFSKNMGLYGERVGALHLLCNEPQLTKSIFDHLQDAVGNLNNSPQIHGQKIVSTILGDEKLKQDWLVELKSVAGRILDIRSTLYRGLKEKNTPGDWEFIIKQKGMFTYMPLTDEQINRMIYHWHVYMLPNGRVCLAGLNPKNINYMINCLDESVRFHPFNLIN